MKRTITILIAILALASCTSKTEDVLMDKNQVEFLGTAFSDFILTDDVTLFLTQNPEDKSKWNIQATVPMKKEKPEAIDSASLEIIPMDDKGIRLIDGLSLEAQDLGNIIPVLNSNPQTEKTIVFKSNKDFSRKEAQELLDKTQNIYMVINALKSKQTEVAEEIAEKEVEAKKKKEQEKPTLNSLCEKYGIYGMLSQYEKHLKNRDKRTAKKVEDQMWEIEKKVRADNSLSESLRKRFVEYIENREDEIEKKY